MGDTVKSAPGAAYNALAKEQGWAGLCDHSLTFRQSELSALYGLWRQARGGAPIPRRSDMTPRMLKAQLRHVAIYEKIECPQKGRRYRVRLMGTKFAEVMGDLTGKFIDEAVPEKFLPRWHAALDAVIESCLPLRFLSRTDTSNKSFLVGEFFEAPLLDDDGASNLVLAAGIHSPLESWDDLIAEEKAAAL